MARLVSENATGLMDGGSCVEDVDLVCEIDHAAIAEDKRRHELEDDATLQRVIRLIKGGWMYKHQGGDLCKDFWFVKD
ncbi:hypothetical protein NDU88_004997 [Pleurodeles waltl]|uniref:Uncharacterized protein n=1 Tax=Pleurodeles waltl TaxID=8319 RepID=A0AAV7MVG8_PLEWA|nr:hypothetical protein NDU88_004997 [Pleurodeles waltl]